MSKRIFNFVCLLLLGCAMGAAAQQNAESPPGREEIVVNFAIPRLLDQDIFVYYDGQTIYAPLSEIFQLLEFRVEKDLSGRRFYGHTAAPGQKFEIDLSRGVASHDGHDFHLDSADYIYNDLDLYLKIDQYQRLFDLPLTFDFSALQIQLPLDKDFPAYQRLRRHTAHEKLRATRTAEEKIEKHPLQRSLFSGATLDWLLSASVLGRSRSQFYNLSLGSMILGGDLALTATGETRNGFDPDQLRYRWHYYFNDSPYLTQAEIGKIYSRGPLARGLTGAVLTNRPQVPRRHFQTIDLNGHLGEGWEVELYIDNRLTDFVNTDARGDYNFNVDIYYGASIMTLKMYGPNGEFKTEEVNVRVPQNLLPQGEVEYSVAAGHSDQRDEEGLYVQAGGFYGIDNHVTVGVSSDIPVEKDTLLSPAFSGEIVVQPLSNLTINGYFVPDYAANGNLTFSWPGRLSINGGYTHLNRDSYRNRLEQLDKVSFSLSSPLRIGSHYLGIRFNVQYDRFLAYSTVNATYGLSTSLSRFHVNYIGKYKRSTNEYHNGALSTLSSQLLLSARILRWLRPQFRVVYDHALDRPERYGVYFAQRVLKTGQLTLSFERNELTRSNTIMATFNFFTDFAGFTTRAVSGQREVTVNQVQQGSIRYDDAVHTLRFDRRSGVGFGSAILRPFKDRNFNGVFDGDDEYIGGLRAKIGGYPGRRVGGKDTYYYDRLRPYDEHVVEVDATSLDNPLLKPISEHFSTYFNPNIVTPIEIPIVTAGEISGLVQRVTDYGRVGVGGLIIHIVNISREIVTEITTFNSGDFYYLGLLPGEYRAYLDPDQLAHYGYRSQPEAVEFTVEAVESGAVVDGIDFLILPEK